MQNMGVKMNKIFSVHFGNQISIEKYALTKPFQKNIRTRFCLINKQFYHGGLVKHDKEVLLS